MMIAGAGGAALINAVLARLTTNAAVRLGARWLTVILVLIGFSWWATRPGVAERFAQETGYLPGAQALAAAVEHDLRHGDVVAMSPLSSGPIRFYLNAAGHRSTFIDVWNWNGTNPCPLILQAKVTPPPRWVFYRIGRQPTTLDAPITSRLFLFVDDSAYRLVLTPRNRLPRSSMDSRTVKRYLDACGYDYQIVNLPSGKIYRLDSAQWGNASHNRPLPRDDVPSRGNGDSSALFGERAGTLR